MIVSRWSISFKRRYLIQFPELQKRRKIKRQNFLEIQPATFAKDSQNQKPHEKALQALLVIEINIFHSNFLILCCRNLIRHLLNELKWNNWLNRLQLNFNCLDFVVILLISELQKSLNKDNLKKTQKPKYVLIFPPTNEKMTLKKCFWSYFHFFK